ncbi:phage portal protein [Plantactinospora solaniradicis]|uniref:Phage portal protein n=1 Tax=Plantactinospora solaniradicis TaxID=1723736 RepID=A0ABW1KKN4_9ACTN
MPYSGTLTVPPGNQGQGQPYNWQLSNTASTGTNFPPGSPEWWLYQGILAIEGKQRDHAVRLAYVEGDHPLPNGDPRYVKALRSFQEKAKTNYVELATNAILPRLEVKGFRFGRAGAESDSKSPKPKPSGDVSSNDESPSEKPSEGRKGVADVDARNSWMSNDMDFQMPQFLRYAAVFGESYLLVSPPDDDSDEPVITVEDPRVCHVFPDPIRPTRALASIRLWRDIYLGRTVAVLCLPDEIHVYYGPSNSESVSASVAMVNGGFSESRRLPNELGEVNLVRCQWRPDGKSEAEGIFSVQDRINLTILDRLVITKSQAYRQRWMTGGQIAQVGKKGKAGVDQKPPFDPGADTLWHVPAPDAKFGDFDQVDITQILSAVRDDVIDAATIQQLPAHYLMGRLANISGDTLTQAESGFVMRIRERQRSVGWALEKAMRLVFKLKGDETKAKELDAEVIWGDPEVRSLAEKADAVLKFSTAFASAPPFLVPVLAQMMNLDPDQTEQLIAAAETYQAEQQEREDAQLQLQTESQIQVAKATKPAPVSNKP